VPVTVNVNDLSVIHQTSNGIATATVPDVCKTPSAAGPVPIPYPNIAMSSDLVSGTTTVTVDGSPAAIQSSKFVKSSGDEAGVAGGVASSVFMMEATFLSFSPTVTFDGQPACRLTDKMLMNKGNTVCMSGTFNPQVASFTSPDGVSEGTAEDADKPKQCVLRGVLIKCSHSTARKLDYIDLSKHETQPLQVISPVEKADQLTIEWDGTCGSNHPYCPSVVVDHAGHGRSPVDKAKGTYDVPGQSHPIAHDWFAVFKLLAMQKDLPHDYYTVNSLLCQGHDTADVGANQWLQVQVFPKAEWKADFSITYKHKNEEYEEKGEKKERPFDYEPDATWVVGGSAEATLGSDKFNYSLESGMKAEGALPLFGPLLRKIGKMGKVFESMSKAGISVKLEPKWPSWKFSGGLKLIEIPGKRIVGSEGNFKFGFNPLFGMEMQISILDWLIRFAGALTGGVAVASFIVKVRDLAAKGFGKKDTFAAGKLDIDILFKVEGEIKGGFGLKYSDGKCETDSEASSVEASMGLSIEGHVIGTGRVWRVEATAAAKIGSGGADPKEPSKLIGTVKPKAGKDPLAATGQLKFTGLALYYLLYYELGVKSEETSPKEHEDDPETTHKKGYQTRDEKTAKCVILEEWTWPKEGAGGE
jgi:uncharacterized Zn-binding protein involved in type VI secretion